MTFPEITRNVLVLAAIVAGALALHIAVFRSLFRFAWRTPSAKQLQHRCRWPARTTTALLAMLLALPVLGLAPEVAGRVTHVLQIALIGAVAWLGIQAAYVAEDTAAGRFDITVRDNLLARRRATQAQVLRRVFVVAIVVLAGAGMLLTFEGARAFGASLLASAGVIGVIAGIAARSTIGNLVAGIQIAFSEPIRLDDVVVVEDEWGWIEEITLTYVVVRLWDKRRLTLPTLYFVEEPFENWTRERAQILGTVELYLDYRTPVDEVRAEVGRILEGNELWDGEVWVVQVTDATEHTMKLRVLVSAEDAPTAWDLRCDVREALVGWLQEHHPEALPHVRLQVHGDREQAPVAVGRQSS